MRFRRALAAMSTTGGVALASVGCGGGSTNETVAAERSPPSESVDTVDDDPSTITLTGTGFLITDFGGNRWLCYAPDTTDSGDDLARYCHGVPANVDDGVVMADDVPVTVTAQIDLGAKDPVLDIQAAVPTSTDTEPVDGSGGSLGTDTSSRVSSVVDEWAGTEALPDALDRWTAELNGNDPLRQGAVIGEGPLGLVLYDAGLRFIGLGLTSDGFLALNFAYLTPVQVNRLEQIVPDYMPVRVGTWLQAA